MDSHKRVGFEPTSEEFCQAEDIFGQIQIVSWIILLSMMITSLDREAAWVETGLYNPKSSKDLVL